MVKFIFRWLFRAFILLIVLAVALVLLKDTLIKSFVENRLRKQTGLEVKIDKLEVGMFSSIINMEGFKIYNSPEYGGAPFIDLPELHVEYDRDALALRKFHLNLVRFNLAEVLVVEGKDGKTN